MGRLAEAHNMQDLDFQLSAGEEGRAVSRNMMDLGKGFAETGYDAANLGDTMLSNSATRFSNAQKDFGGIGTDIFAQGLAEEEINRGYREADLQNQILAQNIPLDLANKYSAFSQNNLNASQSMTNQGLDAHQLALNVGIAEGNLDIGQATNMVALRGQTVGQPPSLGDQLRASVIDKGLTSLGTAASDWFKNRRTPDAGETTPAPVRTD